MCGICGVWRSSDAAPAWDRDLLLRMLSAVRHRGPDANAHWMDAEGRVGLGHARLAIRDLTPTGAQPMVSSSGLSIIAYNGEIYSQADLLGRLARTGFRPRGTSDTELILEHAERFGMLETLPHLTGMFAFALLELSTGTLWLVRDQLGVKPLYYSLDGGCLAFGSELGALTAAGQRSRPLSRDAVAELLCRGAIPAPLTIYEGVRQLLPGHALRCDPDGTVREIEYWSLASVVSKHRSESVSDDELISEAENRLSAAVTGCLVSDVPIGVLLSGGVDSSLVAAMAAREVGPGLQTYTVGFDDPRYDESRFAEAVARDLGTTHHTMRLSEQRVLELVAQLPQVYDQPFADSSQLPTLALAQLVREQVAVVLNGDGGDETFAGYDRHVHGGALLAQLEAIPRALRAIPLRASALAPWAALQRIPLSSRLHVNRLDLAAKAARLSAAARNLDDGWIAYTELAGHWSAGRRVVIGAGEPLRPSDGQLSSAQGLPWQERIQFFDSVSYLPDDLLTKMDRATMSVGLEARVPLLNHDLVEWAWTLPMTAKIRGGRGKWILREVLARHLPSAQFERPKQGFAAPLASWLAGPLRGWAIDLMDPVALRRQGLLDAAAVESLWRQQLRGAPVTSRTWAVLMLLAWLREHPEATV